MIRQDYIIRIIQQAAQALARMLRAGERGDAAEARRHAEDAYDLLGVPSDLALRMDSASLAAFARHPDKVRMLARLSWQEGDLLKAGGDPINALDRYRRAAELLLEVQRLDPKPEDAADLQELMRLVPTNALAARYRD